MKMRVTIEFENDTDSTAKEIIHTLMDALAEFQSARLHNGSSYVNKRYPDNSVYSGERRKQKIEQVNRRILLSERMRCGIERVENLMEEGNK